MTDYNRFFSDPPCQTLTVFADLRLQTPYRLSGEELPNSLTRFVSANHLSSLSDVRIVKVPAVRRPSGLQQVLWVGFATESGKHCLIISEPSSVPYKLLASHGPHFQLVPSLEETSALEPFLAYIRGDLAPEEPQAEEASQENRHGRISRNKRRKQQRLQNRLEVEEAFLRSQRAGTNLVCPLQKLTFLLSQFRQRRP